MTDEQRKRKQFEEWVSGEGYNATRYGDGPFDRYHAAEVNAMWDGYRARDAEVRALRLALSDILRRVTLPVLPSVNACELVLADVARAARAALREGGGE